MAEVENLCCIQVRRFGREREEPPGRLAFHAIADDDVRGLLDLVVVSLGPGDRTEIRLTRGHQADDPEWPDETPRPATEQRPETDDQYCLRIKRYGALGIEEQSGRLNLHMVARSEIEMWLDVTLVTLGPGDRAELILTRGPQ